MFDLQQSLTTLSTTFKYKMKEFAPGKFSLDVALKLKDGSFRYQFVYLWLADIGRSGKKCVYINSRIGKYSNEINTYELLKEAGSGRYSMVTITGDRDKEGNPTESFIVQAAPQISTLTDELFKDIVFEVAENADFLEKKFYGVDLA